MVTNHNFPVSSTLLCLLVSDLYMNVRIFSQFTSCLFNLQRRMLVSGSKRELTYRLGLMYRNTYFLQYMSGKPLFCREGKCQIVCFKNLSFLHFSPRWKINWWNYLCCRHLLWVLSIEYWIIFTDSEYYCSLLCLNG